MNLVKIEMITVRLKIMNFKVLFLVIDYKIEIIVNWSATDNNGWNNGEFMRHCIASVCFILRDILYF